MKTLPLSAGMLSTDPVSSALLLSRGDDCWLKSGGGETQIIIPRSSRYWPVTYQTENQFNKLHDVTKIRVHVTIVWFIR